MQTTVCRSIFQVASASSLETHQSGRDLAAQVMKNNKTLNSNHISPY